MSLFITRIDTLSAIINSEFSFEFSNWLGVLIDVLNEDIQQIEDALNLLTAQSLTATEITTQSVNWPNGVLVYDSTNNVYVGRQAGALVQFTTAPYP